MGWQGIQNRDEGFMSRLKPGLIAGALIAGLMGTTAPAALAQNRALESKSSSSGVLESTLSRAGAVRIIVRHSAPESAMSGDLEQASVAVTSVQDAILRSVGVGLESTGSDRHAVRRLRYTPVFAMTVSREELDKLTADQRVVSIYEDKLESVGLDQSGRIIDPARTSGTAPAAGADGSGTTIAIIDSGVDGTHPFFGGRVTLGGCFSTTDERLGTRSVCSNGQNVEIGPRAGANCPTGVDGCEHGTHVAGIAAGHRTSGSQGPLAGVAPGAKIMALQVFSRIDSAATCNRFGHQAPCALTLTSDQIAALEHVLSQAGRTPEPIAAVNMSLGGGEHAANCDDDPRRLVIQQLRSANVAVVVAAGNNGFTNATNAPACVRGAIPVGSTTKSDAVSDFSILSPIVALFAPGSGIMSSIPGGRFASLDGTSMAAPHVAGAFAVLRARFPNASVDQMEAALKSSGTMIRDGRPQGRNSAARIRVDLAMQALGRDATSAAPRPSTPTPTPAASPSPPVRDTTPAPGAAAPSPGPVATPPPAAPKAPCPAMDATSVLREAGPPPAGC
jgi:subtilisin family serine protease